MKKRAMFLAGQNQYGVLSDMMRRIAEYLEQEKGYEISRLEYEHLTQYAQRKNEDWEFIFSTFGAEFHLFSGVDGRKHVIWLVDHPIYHLSRFENYEDKDNVYIGCVDRAHVTYLKEKCGFKNSFFLPHLAWENEVQIPYEEREIDVFFPASYSSLHKLIKENEEWLTGAVKVVVERVIVYMKQNQTLTLEEAMLDTLRKLEEADAQELADELVYKVGWYIDSYLRYEAREQLVRTLLNAGICLTVCGRNWGMFRETLSQMAAENLIILSEDMPYEQIVDKMVHSKIVLNIMPEFKDGTHERVVMSAINGAVCVTDESRILTELYEHEKSIIFYDKQNLDGLIECIRELLANPKKAAGIALEGKRCTEDNFTVDKIAKWVG